MNTPPTIPPPEVSTVPDKGLLGVVCLALVRAPLARGRKYQFAGYPSGFTVNFVAFRGHPEDDGGLTGVSVTWWGGISRPSMFYPCKNDAEFWQFEIFSNAYDCPNDEMTSPEPKPKDV